MDIVATKIYAVITGDIVRSSRLGTQERRRLLDVMKCGSRVLGQVFAEAVPLAVAVFRGDSWQMLVNRPSLALRAGLFYRAFIKAQMEKRKVDTRMVIGIGTVDFVPGDHVSEGEGPAYQRAGKALENLERHRRMGVVCPEISAETALDTMAQLIDELAKGWSPKQARAVTGALQGWTQKRIGRLWEPSAISQQTVAYHLKQAGWYGVERGLQFFENTVS